VLGDNKQGIFSFDYKVCLSPLFIGMPMGRVRIGLTENLIHEKCSRVELDTRTRTYE
jgi:hypothetical protein